ncbi:MAG: GTP-sensing pleiotropic transcriptional regulator CodY [Selenomonadaceae bacterium]|nr:GTP-sensing pleiotropic transcriptional regulator CodY [Selenomonadaceae bacterium]MBQ3726318.1 GTP-sensing pleiotropic transcriptional regulator CodY [Selenomonadaceae bacterium]MBQ9498379.1 GTP-sensing pleiotropic transcriptional regulator CodY [Selenomonadaceae bacterium]
MTLLEKTRKINKLLQRSENVEYDGISRVLSNVLKANVYIAGKKGEFYGHALVDDEEEIFGLKEVIDNGNFPAPYVKWLNRFDETQVNPKSYADKDGGSPVTGKNLTIVPIYGVGRRIATLIVARNDEKFTDDDLLLAEYGATVVGMEILRDHTEKVEIEARKKATVQIALATLSYSEAEAAVNILSELNGNEGLLVASKIADRVGITRSVIVNALRKFESAGVIESKSLGMKGTYIKIKNEYLMEEVQKLRR